jgi:hypothetical protein
MVSFLSWCCFEIFFHVSESRFFVLQENPVVDRLNSVTPKPLISRPKKSRIAANFNIDVADKA